MEATEIKDKIKDTINKLPLDKLKTALDFLEALQRNEDEETLFLLKEPGLREEYQEAKKDIRTGNTVRWEDIKRDV